MQAALRLSKPVCLPRGGSRIALVQVPHRLVSSDLYLIEPLAENRALDDVKCYVGRAVCTLIKQKDVYYVPVRVTNFNNYKVNITKGATLAEITPIAAEDILSTEEYDTRDVTQETQQETLDTMGSARRYINQAKAIIEEMQGNTNTEHMQQIEKELDIKFKNNSDISVDILNSKLEHLSTVDRVKFKELIYEFRELFSNKQKPPAPTTVHHTIHTLDEVPTSQKPFRIPHAIQPHLDKII
jgi:hypothetical protein